MEDKPIKVLVVDDSLVKQNLIKEALKGNEFEVVGIARNGQEAVEKAKVLKPHVITMDIHMPRMDGLEATRMIMIHSPTPIVIVSATAQIEAKFTSEALKYGALEFVPYQSNWEKFREDLRRKLSVCARVKVIRYIELKRRKEKTHELKPHEAEKNPKGLDFAVMAIGASTGGPSALYKLFSSLQSPLPVPILVVQHMTQGFTEGLVRWLSEGIDMPIKEAQHQDFLKPGKIYVCPGGAHMKVSTRRKIILEPIREEDVYKPSVDRLFLSLAEVFGQKTLALVLTGMGKDGLEGARAIKEKGGVIVTESKESCVVNGMPRAVREAGLSDYDVGLTLLPSLILRLMKQ